MEDQDERLVKLHSALLRILDEIDRICRKNNIQYFLDSGTALGAIRHAGFIPWDDDADVGMVREEYEKFIAVAKKELSSDFFLQNQDTQPEYVQFNSKIRLNDTFFPEERNEGTELHQGIFVDVFPFDYINDNPKSAERDIKKTRRLLKAFALRHRHPQNENLGRKLVRRAFLVVPERILKEKCEKHFRHYNDIKTETLVCHSYKMNQNSILTFKRENMIPSVDIEFEGRLYKIMNNADEYLKTMYGNYMELPPEEKRVCHLNGDIRFE